jgi:hypothetical protein
MRNILHNWAIRAGARVPEMIAATLLMVGIFAAGWIISGNLKSAAGAGGKPAVVKPVEVSSKASSSAMQLAGEMSGR